MDIFDAPRMESLGNILTNLVRGDWWFVKIIVFRIIFLVDISHNDRYNISQGWKNAGFLKKNPARGILKNLNVGSLIKPTKKSSKSIFVIQVNLFIKVHIRLQTLPYVINIKLNLIFFFVELKFAFKARGTFSNQLS